MSSNLTGAVQFSPGLELSERFYLDAVRPILDECFPGLTYSAALIGYGSDVIGFDDPQSTDHMWGPRLYLFLPEERVETDREVLLACLRERLPGRWPVTARPARWPRRAPACRRRPRHLRDGRRPRAGIRGCRR